jgi:hypothetical protein
MSHHALTHVRDTVLLRDLARLICQERVSLAYLLALLGEVDARRLYAPAGFSSMHAYCVGELRFSDDAAYKRIHAARTARKFPMLFAALAEGRLHLTAVCLLAPYLTAENVHELVLAATHRRQPEIEAMLARRLSLPPAPRDRPIVRAIPPVGSAPSAQLAVPHVVSLTFEREEDSREDGESGNGVAERETTTASAGAGDQAPSPPLPAPQAAAPEQHERYLIRLTVEKRVHDKLRYAQALLSHAVPSGNVAQVLDRALDALIVTLERRKFGGTSPRTERPR